MRGTLNGNRGGQPDDSCAVAQYAQAELAEGEGPRVIAEEIVEYSDLMQAIKNRVVDLGIHGTRFDALAGWPEGYLSKLTCARAPRRIGLQSMGALLSAMGVKLQMVEDPAGTARLRQLPPRNESYARPTQTYVIVTNRKWAQIQKLGHQARRAIWGELTPQQRSEMMRALTLKHWRRLSKKQRSELMRALILKRWRGP
jgi:hypothetical protein